MSRRQVIAEFDVDGRPLNRGILFMENRVAQFERGTLSSLGRIEKGFGSLLSSASRLQNVSGIIAGGFGVQMAANFVDQSTRIRRALTEAGDSSEAAFQKAFLASQRSLSGFEAFSQGVARMRKATGGTFDDSVRSMETLNKLLVLGGKTTQERMSTMIQFSQALQAGVLQGEELRSLRENAPIELVQAIAREAGGTIQDLKDFGAEGKLTVEVMIRALQSLEAEADRRMSSVKLTISEAATTLANAGIVAAEAFDKGLGLSRATIAGLTGLAQILGTSAEAAEFFGQAMKLAAGVGLTSFAGRQMNTAIANTRSYGEELRQSAVDTKKAEIASAAAMQKSVARKAAIQAEIAALLQKGAAERTVTAAQGRLATAQKQATAATQRYALAANAASVANERLAFSARATATAGSMMRGAFAFLGGWPGLLLTAGLAMATLASNTESAAEKFERLTTDTGSASSAADALFNVQSLLNEAIEAAGKASDEATQKILANTQAELGAKRTLLDLENNLLIATQAERRAELDRLLSERAGLQTAEDRIPEFEGDLLGVFDQGSAEQMAALADRMAGATIEYNEQLSAVNAKIREMEAVYILAGGQIDRNNALLLTTGASLALASVKSFDLASSLQTAQEYAQNLATTAPAGSWMNSAISAVGALIGRLAAAVGLKQELLATTSQLESAATVRKIPGGVDAVASGDLRITNGNYRRYVAPVIPEAGSSGGSGGGGSGGGSAKKDTGEQDALRFIEQMMTAEEKRAKNMKEMTELRAKLIASYGPEAAIVAQMDEAIKRAAAELSNMDTVAKDFFETLSGQIASSIEDWKGWGSFVRSILASLVNQWGPDFFAALFTPGQQTGEGAGTFLGNLLTGQLHGGGGFENRSARSVPAAAFIGAPRFHNGLASDEFTAILQKGETVLPKGMQLGGGSTTINFAADLRGADPSMKPYIDAKFKQIEREFNGRVVGAIRIANKSRSLA